MHCPSERMPFVTKLLPSNRGLRPELWMKRVRFAALLLSITGFPRSCDAWSSGERGGASVIGKSPEGWEGTGQMMFSMVVRRSLKSSWVVLVNSATFFSNALILLSLVIRLRYLFKAWRGMYYSVDSRESNWVDVVVLTIARGARKMHSFLEVLQLPVVSAYSRGRRRGILPWTGNSIWSGTFDSYWRKQSYRTTSW